MAAKQIGQSLTHPNCEIPYVISNEYRQLVQNNNMGIYFAVDDGEVIFRNPDLIILFYKNLGTLKIKQIPKLMKTTGTFASQLRFALNYGDKFKKGDIIYSYDCFRAGVPSFGYNTFVGYFNFMGFNHEDSIIMSESLAEKAKCNFVETIYIPIFEHTFLQELYPDSPFKYFPGIGQKINGEIVAGKLQPKNIDAVYNAKDLKYKMLNLIKTMNLSDLISFNNKNVTQFSCEQIKSKIENGTVTGIKVHKPHSKTKLLHNELEACLHNLYNVYINEHLVTTYGDLSRQFSDDFSKYIIHENLIYMNRDTFTNHRDFNNCIFLIELEVSDEHQSVIGDKFCNRYANKGVISIILPDELRPMAVSSNMPIDLVFSPFGVFSRMNLSQLLEGMVAKNVMACDRHIKNNPQDTIQTIEWLTHNIIKPLNNDEYYNTVCQLINDMKGDITKLNKFIDEVSQHNLFIEAPAFSEVKTKELFKHSIPPNEDVLIKRETLLYMREKLDVDLPFPAQDVYLKNIFCSPMYIMKLYKLVSHIITARDLGPVKYITKQPLKGRAKSGGSRIGQMEIVLICLL